MNRIARILHIAKSLDTNKYNGDIDILKEEASKYDNAEQLLKDGGFSIDSLDRAAFGFAPEDINELDPKDLKIKWKEDLEQVRWERVGSGLSKNEWAKTIDLSKPIDVIFENGDFYIDDGHHRYWAAKILDKKLPVKITRIYDKPIAKITGEKNYDYDQFHRSFFASAINLKQKVNSLLPKLAKKAQEEYDAWDEENEDEYAGGGICHIIADELADVLNQNDIDGATITHPFKQHVYNIAYDVPTKTAITIDLPEYTYETGAGYSWKKVKDVEITPNDFIIEEVNWDDLFDENNELIEF